MNVEEEMNEKNLNWVEPVTIGFLMVGEVLYLVR